MLNTEEANALLPQTSSKPMRNPKVLKYLAIGQPKWGKTTWGCSPPDTILLACEEGHLFHEAHKIVITCWDRPFSAKNEGWGEDEEGIKYCSFIEAVDAIVASDRFPMVTIDTADMLCKMCLDFHYAKNKVSHASDAGDYGKGWDICLTQPMRQQVGRLMKSGRGIIFITHSQVVEKKKGQTSTFREETTLPSQVQKFLHTQADVILHGSFGKRPPGQYERDRIISLDGSNEVLAGSRIREIRLPKKFIVSTTNPWAQWVSFFENPEAVIEAEAEYTKRMGIDTGITEAQPSAATISEPVGEEESDGGETRRPAKMPPPKKQRSK